ncbi:MAG TPA: hypothetical protein VEJ63_06165 [Planctomycetota bacterium]|nr:hypothetical protein [Planctomycetota bacterium]
MPEQPAEPAPAPVAEAGTGVRFYALSVALLAVATGVILHACWDAPFYRVDDRHHVLPAAAPWSELKGERACYIITRYSLKLDYELFADKSVPPEKGLLYDHPTSWASGIRVMNGVGHLLAGIVLLFLMLRLGLSRYFALWIALAWTAHPMALESVAWICERKNVLCALFGFAALLVWMGGPHRPIVWLGTAALYALSLYSKGTALGLGPVFAILAAYHMHRAGRSPLKAQHWTMPLIGLGILFALTLAGAAYTYQAFRQDMIEPPGGSTFTAVLTNLEVVSKYLRSVFAPFWLSFYYGIEPVYSLGDWRVWAYGPALIAVFGMSVWFVSKEQRSLALLGIAWFLFALAPHANLLSSSFLMQDRFIYLGTPGILLAAGLAMQGVLQKARASSAVLKVIATGFIAMLLALSAERSRLYASGDAVELHAAENEPRSAYAQLAAARIFRRHIEIPDRGALSPASEQYARATLEAYDRALAAPDFVNYGNPFVVRIQKAEMLLLLEKYEAVRELLNGWLPPKDLKLLPPGDETVEGVTRRIMYTGYRPEALAHAWAVVADSYLRQSFQPQLIHSQRVALIDLGVEAAKSSMFAHHHDFEGAMMLARLLLRRSALLKSDVEAAQDAWDEAMAILTAIPTDSSQAAEAQRLMRLIPRPRD